MNKKILLVGIAAMMFGATAAMAEPATVAVVDVPAVVSVAPAVQALKKEQEANAKAMISFIEKARKDVAAAKDESKKKSLEEKYNKELVAKKEAFEKDYAAKLAKIDASISKTIEETAKAAGYNVVITKGAVLYGGTDITEAVKKAVKK